ncbi:MAG TPA: hypothetical protein VMB83_03725, partial [Roseiarcus sp.]|nr:hypothetical protein [Roseiarcus sp.]
MFAAAFCGEAKAAGAACGPHSEAMFVFVPEYVRVEHVSGKKEMFVALDYFLPDRSLNNIGMVDRHLPLFASGKVYWPPDIQWLRSNYVGLYGCRDKSIYGASTYRRGSSSVIINMIFYIDRLFVGKKSIIFGDYGTKKQVWTLQIDE